MKAITLVRLQIIQDIVRDDKYRFIAFVYPAGVNRNFKVEVSQATSLDNPDKWEPATLAWPSTAYASGEEGAAFGIALQMAVDLAGQRNRLTGAA